MHSSKALITLPNNWLTSYLLRALTFLFQQAKDARETLADRTRSARRRWVVAPFAAAHQDIAAIHSATADVGSAVIIPNVVSIKSAKMETAWMRAPLENAAKMQIVKCKITSQCAHAQLAIRETPSRIVAWWIQVSV